MLCRVCAKMVRRGGGRDPGPLFRVPVWGRAETPSPEDPAAGGLEEPLPADNGDQEQGEHEPDREPVGRHDRSLSPPSEGRWTDRGILPPAPTPLPWAELDKLLEKEALGKAQKVYVVNPAPWPGVYLSWTSVASQTVGVPGTHQCAEKRGIFPALDTLRRATKKSPHVYR